MYPEIKLELESWTPAGVTAFPLNLVSGGSADIMHVTIADAEKGTLNVTLNLLLTPKTAHNPVQRSANPIQDPQVLLN